jgi:uncharacterized membrane protein
MREKLSWRLVAETPYGFGGVAFAILCAFVVLVLSLLSLRGERRRARALTLVGFRFLSLTGALVLFFQPALRQERLVTLPNHIAVLVDGSESMNLSETGRRPTRAERAAGVIASSHQLFDALRRDHELDFFRFGAGIEPSNEAALAQAYEPSTEASTHLGEALGALKERYADRDLGGVVVLSDGTDNGWLATAPPEADDVARSLAAPIHTVWVGRGGLQDVAIARIRSDDFGFVRTALQVEAEIRVTGAKEAGWVGRSLPVELLQNGVAISTASLVVEARTTEYHVTFSLTPDRVGKFLYRISTPVLSGEALTENNSKAFLLKVIRDKIRILHVAGRPSYDERFLRELFKHDPNVDLISFFILRTPTDIENAPNDELSLIPFPTEELFRDQLRSFDLVVLQNFNYAPYEMGVYLPEIRRYVEEGGGLVMLGGELSFDLGGYAGTPIADVLPVELIGGEHLESSVDTRPFRLRLTSEGKRHPVTALHLNMEQNRLLWTSLPHLWGTNLIQRASPNAVVLGTHPFLKAIDGSPLPILTVGEFKKGRALAFTSDSSWRWRFSEGKSANLAEKIAPGEAYQLFWEAAARWLIHDPSVSRLRIENESTRYSKTQPINLRVRAFGPDYRGAKGVDAMLSIEREGSPPTRVFTAHGRTDAEGLWPLNLGRLPPGGYQAITQATVDGRVLEERDAFLVDGAGPELERPAARDDLLRTLSTASQGQFRDSEGSKALAGLSFLPNRTRSVGGHQRVEIWTRLPVLFAIMLIILIEWLLRRRWGYR